MICSIVAVHGINGDHLKTWTDKTSGRLWLKEFLPSAVPTARVMTFGYNSTVAFSKSVSTLDGYARELLNALRLRRGSCGVSESDIYQRVALIDGYRLRNGLLSSYVIAWEA